ncbi:hypothetical protein ABRP91_04130 [Pectobacterium brasiliense]
MTLSDLIIRQAKANGKPVIFLISMAAVWLFRRWMISHGIAAITYYWLGK